LQLVLEGRGLGDILNGAHDSLAALTDTLREVVGVVLTTNARPARPRQRTPLGGRAGQTPLGDTRDGADSLTESLLRRRCAAAASGVVSGRAPPGVRVRRQAGERRLGTPPPSRPRIRRTATAQDRCGQRPTTRPRSRVARLAPGHD